MPSITNTTQFSTFALIRGILISNTTLKTKFNLNYVFEFEPKHKSINFCGFPYLVIQVPTTETDLLTFNHANTIKDFNVTILMVMDYEARDNVTNYCNALIKAIESKESSFQSVGYYNPKIELISAVPEIQDQKQLIVSEFRLELMGGVER